jgi:hypothetical protein
VRSAHLGTLSSGSRCATLARRISLIELVGASYARVTSQVVGTRVKYETEHASYGHQTPIDPSLMNTNGIVDESLHSPESDPDSNGTGWLGLSTSYNY